MRNYSISVVIVGRCHADITLEIQKHRMDSSKASSKQDVDNINFQTLYDLLYQMDPTETKHVGFSLMLVRLRGVF